MRGRAALGVFVCGTRRRGWGALTRTYLEVGVDGIEQHDVSSRLVVAHINDSLALKRVQLLSVHQCCAERERERDRKRDRDRESM